MSRRGPIARGFTLVELLVALAIFAILAALSYRTLDGALRAREHLAAEDARLTALALFFARFQDDIDALIDRRAVNADGRSDDALRLAATAPGADDATLVFSRAGFAGGFDSVAAPQRIGYRLREGSLQLLIWPGADQAPRSQPQVHAVLSGVRELEWRAMDQARQWQGVWRSTNIADPALPSAFPRAIEVTLTLADGRRISRVFATRKGAAGAAG